MSVSATTHVFQRDDLGIGRGLKHLGLLGGAVATICLLTSLLLSSVLGVALLVLGVGIVGSLAAILFFAKGRVLRDNHVSIWNGYGTLVSWNPAEGVVFLKDKRVQFVDDGVEEGGGIRLIYPSLGEEIVLRVPLEIQTLSFIDNEVLTKEYVPLSLRGTMYWRINDIERFYLSISREIHSADDRGQHSVSTARHPQIVTAEYWLRSMAEEKTRSVVAKVGTGLLLADQLSVDLPKELPESASLMAMAPGPSEYCSATEGLANLIKTEFEADVGQYGLEIHRVALQDMKLPSDIYAAAIDACRSSYLPLKARAEAIAKRLHLQAEADVIGAEALGLREIAGNIPALAFQEFLSPILLDFSRKREPGAAAPTEAAVPLLNQGN